MFSVIRLILTARQALLALMLALIMIALSGCGLKGDLYLPETIESSSESVDSDHSENGGEETDATGS